MQYFLGIDTSNYRTSVAVCDGKGNIVKQVRKLLEVKEGGLGLRQSDALFAHTKVLPSIMEEVGAYQITAVGYSARPRDVQGSYMPCFLAGESVARGIAAICGIPSYDFSHQAGHIEAAKYSVSLNPENQKLLEKEPFALDGRFLAFHVSGGTTEALLVDNGRVTLLGQTLDLNAGQVIDRVGVMLGLGFPCGAELEALAENAERSKGVKISVKGFDCNLAGVENMAKKRLEDGESPKSVAAFTLDSVLKTLDKMTENLVAAYPELPILYAGGVMACARIKKAISQKYRALFALPELSGDNAVGTALLAKNKFEQNKG